MKIQIKPVYYSEFFPNRKKQPLYPITRDYSVQPTRYSGKYCVSMKTRKQLAEKVSKKLSLSLEEVMTTYKDKIETAYWNNIYEYIKAEITDFGLLHHGNFLDSFGQSSIEPQSVRNGWKSAESMISIHKPLYPNGFWIDGDKWSYYYPKDTDESLKERFKQDADTDFLQWHRDFQKILFSIDPIDVEFYDFDGNVTKRKKIYIEDQKDQPERHWDEWSEEHNKWMNGLRK
jgi:hypothetical protein